MQVTRRLDSVEAAGSIRVGFRLFIGNLEHLTDDLTGGVRPEDERNQAFVTSNRSLPSGVAGLHSVVLAAHDHRFKESGRSVGIPLMVESKEHRRDPNTQVFGFGNTSTRVERRCERVTGLDRVVRVQPIRVMVRHTADLHHFDGTV